MNVGKDVPMMMTVGEAAKAVGVSPKAIRVWESRGLIPQIQRTATGYRTFTETDLASLRFIMSGEGARPHPRRNRGCARPAASGRESLRAGGAGDRHAPCHDRPGHRRSCPASPNALVGQGCSQGDMPDRSDGDCLSHHRAHVGSRVVGGAATSVRPRRLGRLRLG